MSGCNYNVTSMIVPGDAVWVIQEDSRRSLENGWVEYEAVKRKVWAIAVRPSVGTELDLFYICVPAEVTALPTDGGNIFPKRMVFTNEHDAERVAWTMSQANRPAKCFEVDVCAKYTRAWTVAVAAKTPQEARKLVEQAIQGNIGLPPDLQTALHADYELSEDKVDIEGVHEAPDGHNSDVDLTKEC